MKPKVEAEFTSKPILPNAEKPKVSSKSKNNLAEIDRTTKMYIGGKQARPDGGYSTEIKNAFGEYIGEVSEGNRKDIRNAVEAAHAEKSWGGMTGHARAQVLYYIAENLAIRAEEFAERIVEMTNQSLKSAQDEVEKSIERIYTYAAFADKYDGAAHSTVQRMITLAMPEAIGVMAIICPDENPLLGFISVSYTHLDVYKRQTMGLAPVIGIPLPLLSYGGSSLLTFTIMIAILVRLDADRQVVLR